MNFSDPTFQWVAGGVAVVLGWFARALILRQERRTHDLEVRVSTLETQMAAQRASYDLIHEMNRELQDLIKLTNRIAGHLKID